MAIILTTNQVIEAAHHLKDDGRFDESELNSLLRGIETAQMRLARRVAEIEGVSCKATSYEVAYNVCSDFAPGPNGQTSELLTEFDSGGEWGSPTPEAPTRTDPAPAVSSESGWLDSMAHLIGAAVDAGRDPYPMFAEAERRALATRDGAHVQAARDARRARGQG